MLKYQCLYTVNPQAITVQKYFTVYKPHGYHILVYVYPTTLVENSTKLAYT